MKGSQLTALNALFHLILVPALITTFGNPTKMNITNLLLKPRVTSNLYVFCLLAIGFSAYAIPLILCAHAQSFNEQYEKHLLVIPSIITLVCTFASCVAGSLDTRVMWKFFPTPAFYGLTIGAFISDAYAFVHYIYIEKIMNDTQHSLNQ
ncbi:Uncharacterized protein QTN25_004203 [Entamoeba marina]